MIILLLLIAHYYRNIGILSQICADSFIQVQVSAIHTTIIIIIVVVVLLFKVFIARTEGDELRIRLRSYFFHVAMVR